VHGPLVRLTRSERDVQPVRYRKWPWDVKAAAAVKLQKPDSCGAAKGTRGRTGARLRSSS